MRIAITGPHFWPYRRRGSAAYMYHLSKYLSAQGHEVEVVTSTPARSKVVNNGNVHINYIHSLQHQVLEYYHVDRVHTFALNCFRYFITKRKFDIIHCIYHSDAYAVNLLKKFNKFRYVYLVTTTPFKLHHQHSPIDHYMFERAISGASKCIVPSRYAQECMQRDYKLGCELIPCGVDTERFKPGNLKDLKTPRILCAAALHDERKKIPLLVKAFELLRKSGTKAILQLTGETTVDCNQRILSLVDNETKNYIQILPDVTYDQLSKLYASAAVTVLPSVNETFGMNMIESLACGTPVVGTCSGALPEIISDPSVGTLFDAPEAEAFPDNTVKLCEAIKKTLELAKNPGTRQRCRDHAVRYDWLKVVKKIESLYEKVLVNKR